MNQFSEIKVTVLLPISRRDEYFVDALQSIIFQTYKDIEIIVLVNGMSDQEFLWVCEVCSSDSRIKVIRLSLRGLTFALNYGLEISSGVYIARMDADDVSLPERIESQMKYLEENSNCDVVGGRITLINDAGEAIKKEFKFYETHEEIAAVLPYRNPLCHPALMFRRESLMNIGGYKFGLMSEDHELFIRMMLFGMKFHNLDKNIFCYRRHENQLTSQALAKKNFAEISGFLLIYFIKTKNFKFLLGSLAIHPAIRRMRGLIWKT